MSFNFGQFKRTDLAVANYFSSINNYTILNDQPRGSLGLTFNEKCMHLNQSLSYGKTYYLEFTTRGFEDNRKITIILKNSNNNENEQEIDLFNLSPLQTTKTFNVIITPNTQGYDKIIFQLERNANDLSESTPAELTINISTFGEVKDLLKSPINISPLIKIGVQGPAGMLMIINGQPIRIGPSGIYEINNGYKIKSFGVILKENNSFTDNNDYFILDYQY